MNNFNPTVLALRLFAARQKMDISFTQMRRMTGIPQSLLSNWENAQCSPSAKHLFQLAKFFNVSTDFLLGLSHTEHPFDYPKTPYRIIENPTQLFENPL